jgi:hypothetical protein
LEKLWVAAERLWVVAEELWVVVEELWVAMEGGLALDLPEPEPEPEPEPGDNGARSAAAEVGAALQPTRSRRRSLTEMASHSVGHIHVGRKRGNSNAAELDALVGVDKGGRSDSEITAWLEEVLPLWESDEQLRKSKVCPADASLLAVHASQATEQGVLV